MLINDPYSFLPAFTLAGILGILLWPENIPYKSRLLLYAAILVIWVAASALGIAGYGTAENPMIYLVNLMVGLFGLIALIAAYRIKPSRNGDPNPGDQ